MPDNLKHGDPIPGSKYVRAFCPACKDPMRVLPDQLALNLPCDDCAGFTIGAISITAPEEVAAMLVQWRDAGLRDAALEVVGLYYFGNNGLGMSMSEVAAKVGCSAQNVQQVVDKAAEKLQAAGLTLPAHHVGEKPEGIRQLSVADGSNPYRKVGERWKRDENSLSRFS